MSTENFFTRTRLYITKYLGSKENHDLNKKTVSAISGPLSIFFIVANYFNFLKAEDKHSWKGIIFLFLSTIYALFCSWLYIEGFWKGSG